jgi:hypothetical protein
VGRLWGRYQAGARGAGSPRRRTVHPGPISFWVAGAWATGPA